MQILTDLQEEILKIFAKTEEAELFYLTGGTALATFYLQHRLSKDLDFFTPEEEAIGYMGERLKSNLAAGGIEVRTIRKLKSFYEILASKEESHVPIHLALDSPFRFEKVEEIFSQVRVDSLIDIATNKLLTVYGRAEPRDFVDVFFLVKEKFSMDQLIEKSKFKDPGLDEYYLAIAFHRAKEFPEDILKFPVSMVKHLDIKEMKDYFVTQSLLLLNKAKEKGVKDK
jgi:predicted nucleotidyltransferase component of viral defense system